jgi:uncharacterized membrane protein
MEKHALDKFSDRAICVTIASLILVFSLPIGKIAALQTWGQCVPHLAVFVFTFLMISVFWTAQSKIISLIAKPLLIKKVVWVTHLYFFFLLLLPLSAGLMAGNPYLPASIVIYSFNLLVISLTHLLLLNSALKYNYRGHQQLSRKIQKSLNKLAIVGPCCYAIAIGVCYINAYVSFIAIIAAPLSYGFLLNKKAIINK